MSTVNFDEAWPRVSPSCALWSRVDVVPGHPVYYTDGASKYYSFVDPTDSRHLKTLQKFRNGNVKNDMESCRGTTTDHFGLCGTAAFVDAYRRVLARMKSALAIPEHFPSIDSLSANVWEKSRFLIRNQFSSLFFKIKSFRNDVHRARCYLAFGSI